MRIDSNRYSDMLTKLRRVLIAAQFRADRRSTPPPNKSTPRAWPELMPQRDVTTSDICHQKVAATWGSAHRFQRWSVPATGTTCHFAMVPAGSVDGWSSGYKTASSGRSLPRQVAANSCTGRLSASPRQMIVPNPGEGSRPVSILRRVSGEMPAACATSARSRPARAWRSSAPRRLPASICSGVSGWRTMLPGYSWYYYTGKC
jgi:hypothetical protein